MVMGQEVVLADENTDLNTETCLGHWSFYAERTNQLGLLFWRHGVLLVLDKFKLVAIIYIRMLYILQLLSI